MALSRVTVWTAGQVLTAADLGGEFNNILSNPIALISPTTGNINYANNQAISFNLELVSADPTAVSTGRVMFNTAKLQPQVDDGSVIRTIPALISTALTQGDLIVTASSGSGAFKPITIGNAGQALVVTSSGGSITWGTPSVSGGGDYTIQGLTGSVTTGQTGSFACDYIKLRSSAGTATFQMNATSSFTVNAGIVGVGGRDQAGNFASTFVHAYVVSTGANSTTPIGLLSTIAPPVGPTLPSSCSAWCYLATFLYSSTSTTFAAAMNVAGREVYYEAAQSALSSGTATTETAVSLIPLVPLVSRLAIIEGSLHAPAANSSAKVRYVTLKDFWTFTVQTAGDIADTRVGNIPNSGRQLFYIITNTAGTGTMSFNVLGYTVPNGDA